MPSPAHFPGAIWDGSSRSRVATEFQAARQIYQSPDNADWDQVISEMIAVQTAVTNLGSGIGVNGIAESQVINLVSHLALKAPLVSPALTGTPSAPTATAGDNTTQIATTAFVIANVPVTSVAARTGAITLAESDITGLVSDLALKAPLASPALTGTPTGDASALTTLATGSTTARSLALRGADRFNVKDYGAVGNGSTDDTAAIQATADAAKAAGDGVVFIPAPSAFYRITAPIYLNCSMRGEGMPTLRADAGTGNGTHALLVVNDYSGSGLVIQGMHLDGQWSGGTAGEYDHGVGIGHSSNVTVRGCLIENPYGDCVFIGPVDARSARSGVSHSVSGWSSNILVADCNLLNPRRCCVAVVSVRTAAIHRNVMTKPTPYVAAIDVERDNDSGQSIRDILISENIYSGNDIFVNFYNPLSSDPLARVTISRNTSTTPNIHVSCSPTSPGFMSALRILDNRFLGVSTVTASLLIVNCSDRVEIRGNRDGTNPLSGWTFIGVSADIVGNVIVPDNSGRSVALSIGEGCSSCVIRGNLISGISSGFGSIAFVATVAPTSGHVVAGNIILGASYGIRVSGQPITSSWIQGNSIGATTRGISIEVASDVAVTADNVTTGGGMGLFGQNFYLSGPVKFTPVSSGGTLTLGRYSTGGTNGGSWSLGVENPSKSDQLQIGFTSTTYLTGGAIRWLGNGQPYLYFPNGRTFSIGTGIGTIAALAISPDLSTTFGGHAVFTGGIPTISAGAGAGTSPTISIGGSDQAGLITVTTGTGPTVSATVVTVTFGSAFATIPRSITLTPGGPNAASLTGSTSVYADSAATSTTQFVLVVGSGGLVASTTYKWYFAVVG